MLSNITENNIYMQGFFLNNFNFFLCPSGCDSDIYKF